MQGLIDFWKKNFDFSDREIEAFRQIKREYFIPESLRGQAYEDTPLPILRGKTISQPTTVMIMTSGLELREGEKVFEVGAGSGYQAGLIGYLVGEKGRVITTEVIPELVPFARENIRKAGLNNIKIIEMDGSKGFEDNALFDKIIITAACREFPKELVDQLKIGGIIIGPVGTSEEQVMVRGRKGPDGRLDLDFLGPFVFSPLYGKYGFEA